MKIKVTHDLSFAFPTLNQEFEALISFNKEVAAIFAPNTGVVYTIYSANFIVLEEEKYQIKISSLRELVGQDMQRIEFK